jgi:predicted 3-demethylubiquinone-9 3-methyltransferase (glyoxalase superfamily)
MAQIQKISPCLWFDHQAEEAAGFYTKIFKNSTAANEKNGVCPHFRGEVNR